ncbi:TIGR02300 family protein [Enhydrobacter aerosaccus]|uniref:TIGR02300 family protein n=1 Tax=Enhydrobacter aerosaccus TaxID=225324 RepID=A0A1T4R9G4_9HYPH|nr:TIGR02300 family protein [Enhydrobacter aerosaccus]SKA12652.1 TIGR02300 family protein [Enhydrobacter aerosaccus]
MVKASWGIKRTCQNCAARFYDLNKSPIKCPKCGREHDREDFVKVRRGRAAAAATTAAAAAAAAAAKAAAAKNKKIEDVALGDDDAALEADDEALEDTDDLADEADDIEVDVEDDKGEGDR